MILHDARTVYVLYPVYFYESDRVWWVWHVVWP
jgi:hypothetical protein